MLVAAIVGDYNVKGHSLQATASDKLVLGSEF